MKAIKIVKNAWNFLVGKFLLLTLYVYGYCGIAQAKLPTISGPGGSDSSDSGDLFQLFIQIIKWGITVIVELLVVLLMATVLKNAWNKYHQIGEDGSRATFRDLIGHLVVGAGLLAIGVAIAFGAISVFGEGTINS